jgi:hypothetical protein
VVEWSKIGAAYPDSVTAKAFFIAASQNILTMSYDDVCLEIYHA